MLTGRPAFGEATVTDTLAAIVTREPDWKALPAGLPGNVQWVLRQCLQRDLKRRLRDIADAVIALDDASTVSTGPPHPAIVRRGVPLWIVGATVAVAVAATAGLVRMLVQPAEQIQRPGSVRQFHIPAPYLVPDAQHRPVIAPDGRRIAWSADGTLWVREMQRGETTALAKDVDPTHLSWSPDSDAIMFVSQNQLMRAAIGGGLMRITDMKFRRSIRRPGGRGSRRSIRVRVRRSRIPGVEIVPAHGGAFRTLFPPPQGVKDFHSPTTLPGAGFLVVVDRRKKGPTESPRSGTGRLQDVSMLPGERLEGPVYAPSGPSLYDVRSAAAACGP